VDERDSLLVRTPDDCHGADGGIRAARKAERIMLLAIDVGNTNTCWTLPARCEKPSWLRTGGPTHRSQTADEYGFCSSSLRDERMAPSQCITSLFLRWCASGGTLPGLRDLLSSSAALVEPWIKTGMPVLVDNRRN